MDEQMVLTNKEKALIALGAAMGGGCRTCAEHLHPMAREAGATPDEIACALRDGLRVRQSATEVMRQKAGALLGQVLSLDTTTGTQDGARLSNLTRLAAAVAANSAPDALRHLETARAGGTKEAAIGIVMGISRKVRGKGQMFSDMEIDESHHGTSSSEAKPSEGTRAAEKETSFTSDPPAASDENPPQGCACT